MNSMLILTLNVSLKCKYPFHYIILYYFILFIWHLISFFLYLFDLSKINDMLLSIRYRQYLVLNSLKVEALVILDGTVLAIITLSDSLWQYLSFYCFNSMLKFDLRG